VRHALLVQCDKFAIDHGVGFNAFECFRDLEIIVADDFAVAAIERDFAVFNPRDHPKTIILIFEHPAGIVERAVG
jgi:hypothetical protein